MHTSFCGIFGWFFTVLFIALPANSEDVGDSEHEQFLPLELLERDVIRRNRVKAVVVAISSGTRHQTDETESCLVESFEFNVNGNLVLHSPPLVSSDYYFSYNENNELADYGRVDSDGGTYSLAKYLEDASSLVKTYEAEREADDATIVRSVSSACFNIDAEYRFSPEYGKNGLPRSAPAHKIRELESGVFSASGSWRSPERLRVEFSYEIWIAP